MYSILSLFNEFCIVYQVFHILIIFGIFILKKFIITLVLIQNIEKIKMCFND
jgi:hypothetical protein